MIDLIFLELVRDIEEKYNYIFPSNLVEHLSNISFRQKNEITYYGIILPNYYKLESENISEKRYIKCNKDDKDKIWVWNFACIGYRELSVFYKDKDDYEIYYTMSYSIGDYYHLWVDKDTNFEDFYNMSYIRKIQRWIRNKFKR